MLYSHVPVMPRECTEGLCVKESGIYVDCTLGGGGHSELILSRLVGGRLIANDKDSDAINHCRIRLEKYAEKITYINDDFKRIKENLEAEGIYKVDGIIADLGVSSYQLDNSERGFSYMGDAPLDMRMNRSASLSAADVVNGYDEYTLAKIIYEYGEERLSRKIARNIVSARNASAVRTTAELAAIVERSIPAKERYKGGNPCKKTFQAIRIEVNGELEGLGAALEDMARLLKPKGRLCVLTFHSLEDRIAKNTFASLNSECICPPRQPICTCNKIKEINIVNKKPITAGAEELEQNSRAKSAKLRIIEKI